MLYLIDKQTKEKIAMGTDVKKVHMLMAVLYHVRPCFILTLIHGGKAVVA